ncbi:hypothetical protein [Cellulomonas sp. HD19AZ1]|uniref:hypothetical protein n=1 Tax=Cellulomonas sp. HD19AZ1 TaxID=2559593 RepID=UPI001070C45A|nr:hypothetical protein [Cellulomonas sp. HD19AZ1]TFH71114.1 hypothetical protein E4A51_09655 [Cellulomonas sp. HD19AZ1]
MSDAPRKGGGTSSKRAQNGAFLAIGVTFFVLGITQMAGDSDGGGIAFLTIGIVFMAMSTGWFSSPGGDEKREDAGGAAAGADGTRESGDDAAHDAGPGDAGAGSGGGDGGGGGD